MSTKIQLDNTWKLASDGTKACIIVSLPNGFGLSSGEIAIETAAPTDANYVGLPIPNGINLPATTEKIYIRGQGTALVTLYSPK